MKLIVAMGLAVLAAQMATTAGAAETTRVGDYVFEELGRPITPKAVDIGAVTTDAAGKATAWGVVESPDQFGVIGIDVVSGKSKWIDLRQFGESHIRLHRAENGKLYMYVGSPDGHFVSYDPATAELADLGAPAPDTSYVLHHGIGMDGKMYVGSFPDARLVRLDPATDTVEDLGRIPEDPKEKYIIRTEISDDNWVYCAVGLHHAELWAVNPETREKAQILPDDMTALQGTVAIQLGEDGRVYGKKGGEWFRCTRTGIEMVDAAPPVRRAEPEMAGAEQPVRVNAEGELELGNPATKAKRVVKTDFEGITTTIFSVSDERDGVIYGSGISPATLYSYDTKTGEMKDHGRVSGGRIQVYDVLNHEKGLFLSSYMGATQDLYEPETKKKTAIAGLGGAPYGQERAKSLAVGPDGRIYTGTVPVKGRVGGAIVRIDPKDLSYKVWTGLLTDISFNWVVPVPATGEMFYTTTIQGGSSAIPTQDEAYVTLWNVKEEKLAWKEKIIPGTRSYGEAAMGSNGLIYGLAGEKYYAFDPVARKVVHVAEMPFIGDLGKPALADKASGPEKLIYGIGGGGVFVIDPKDHAMRVVAKHPSLEEARGIYVTQDGTLYYGSGSKLWRMKPAR